MKIINDNKKDLRNYEIIEKFECGIVLQGWEVKSARAAHVNLSGSYISIYKNEIYLKDSYFGQYMLVKCDPTQDRKLLMHKNQILKLKFESEAKRLTIVPTKIYFNNQSKIKLEIALVKGLKKHDKRDKIIKEETQKQIAKTLKFY
ncbi:SsrA-binding protein [Mycoplasmopsis ciconiae]|uniref:SsrA-binding protein n=1 Tax=Mycoplasmopsis ciconiae TaxID=561067 RepID=A0ABU7MN00_9BACT|nr:SsrA-binding protein [Mycoplasmopsis ciconiae]